MTAWENTFSIIAFYLSRNVTYKYWYLYKLIEIWSVPDEPLMSKWSLSHKHPNKQGNPKHNPIAQVEAEKQMSRGLKNLPAHLNSTVEPVHDLLAISKVDGAEQWVLLRGRLAMLVLIQEDGSTAHLHAELLDALFVVHGEQEGLESGLGLDGKEDGEIFWENSPWGWKKQQTSRLLC